MGNGPTIRALIAYDTLSCATADTAATISDELTKSGLNVDLKHIGDIREVGDVDAVVVGSPIRFGACSPKVREFLTKNSSLLNRIPVACFFSSMAAVELNDRPLPNIPIYVDPAFGGRPRRRNELGPFGYAHSVYYYITRFMESVSDVRPVTAAFFKGRLDFTRLRFHQRCVMRLVCFFYREIKEGDFINPDAARAWARLLRSELDSPYTPDRGST